MQLLQNLRVFFASNCFRYYIHSGGIVRYSLISRELILLLSVGVCVAKQCIGVVNRETT